MPSYQDENFYILRNSRDMSIAISDRGASLVSWLTPDRYGNLANVLLGCSDPNDYIENPGFFGSIIGRWANRIADGRFTLDGASFNVDRNDGNHHLHGGDTGFHKVPWTVQQEPDGLRFFYLSPDGDGGYPGNVSLEVRFRLDDLGQLTIDYEAKTDSATPLNLTSHPYFNLNGGSLGIEDHLLFINASHYFKTDSERIPVQLTPVAGSAFDFRQPAPIGSRMAWPDAQLMSNGGFDHCYCVQPSLDGRVGKLREVATVYDPCSGRKLSISTDQAGLQFYTGNFLAGVKGSTKPVYENHDGFCLEAQAYPNQINGPYAEETVLRPGQVYRQTTIYRIWL